MSNLTYRSTRMIHYIGWFIKKIQKTNKNTKETFKQGVKLHVSEPKPYVSSFLIDCNRTQQELIKECTSANFLPKKMYYSQKMFMLKAKEAKIVQDKHMSPWHKK